MTSNDWQVIHLHARAPMKPRLGDVCNGCGACCASAPCPISLVLLQHRQGPCPALRWSDEAQRYWCGMVVQPSHYLRWLPMRLDAWFSKRVLRWIAANQACDFNAEMH